jgi:hypothetical protein
LPAFYERSEPLEIFRMSTLDPFKQRPGIVQPDANGRMPLEDLDEWQVGTGIGPLEYIVEIPHWLMSVYQENELEFGHRGPRRSATE